MYAKIILNLHDNCYLVISLFLYSFIWVVNALCMMIGFYYDFSCLFFIACELTLIDFMKEFYMLLRYVPFHPLLILWICMVCLSDMNYDFTIVLIVYHLIFGIHWFANQLSLLPQLISRNLYLRFREVLPYGAFFIGNLTLGLRLGFQRHIFSNKESFFRVLFLILFSLLEINKNKWQL